MAILSQSPQKIGVFSYDTQGVFKEALKEVAIPSKNRGVFLRVSSVFEAYSCQGTGRNPLKKSGCFPTEKWLIENYTKDL